MIIKDTTRIFRLTYVLDEVPESGMWPLEHFKLSSTKEADDKIKINALEKKKSMIGENQITDFYSNGTRGVLLICLNGKAEIERLEYIKDIGFLKSYNTFIFGSEETKYLKIEETAESFSELPNRILVIYASTLLFHTLFDKKDITDKQIQEINIRKRELFTLLYKHRAAGWYNGNLIFKPQFIFD